MRQLRDQNISFLLKLGYKMVADEDAFWARVLDQNMGLQVTYLNALRSLRVPSCGNHYQKFGAFYVKTSYGPLVMGIKFVIERILGSLILDP